MNHRYFFLILIFPALMLCAPEKAPAQSQVQIIRADVLEGEQTPSGPVRKLIGNVELRTDDAHILADSAFHFLELNLLRAFGNVQIETEKNELIWADRAMYDTESEESEFEGNVIIKTREATIFSQRLRYDFFFEIAAFPDRLRLEDEDGILVADRGLYFAESDSAAFVGNVQVSDESQYIEADSLYSRREIDYYELHGNVFLFDIENRTRIVGDYSESDSTGYRLVEGNTRLQRINEAETDTTFLIANRLEMFDSDTLRIVDSFGNVSIWSETYASLSDSARFDDLTEEFFLYGNARLWQDELQLSSPQIDIQLVDDEVDELLAYTRPFAATPDSASGRLNQIEGDSLRIYFEEGKVKRIHVKPNGEMIFHSNDENDEPDGALQLTGEQIIMFFSGGDADSMNVYRGIEGQYLPESPEVENLRLPGFIWEPERRPQRPENWLHPARDPIPEERPFPLPRRYQEYLEGVIQNEGIQNSE